MTDVPAIRCEGVSFSYDAQPILSDISLDIDALDFSCVVGPNGGGKTTFLKLLLGLLGPTTGSIRIFGDSPAANRHRVGYVPQHLHYDPFFPVRVLDVVLMGRLHLHTWGRFSKDDCQQALAALERTGMAERAQDPFSALSGGQRQKVLIARALAGNPDLLLLDEPSANIDLKGTRDLYTMLQELNRDVTILLVSHDLGFVSKVVKSVLCIRGTAVFHPTSEISGEIIQELYGLDMRMIRHDHRCAKEGHSCLSS